MIIDEKDLDGFSSEVVDQCISTRRERVPAYNSLRHYYQFGAPEGQQAPYNKMYPHVDLLASYLYSQSTVEFDVAVENQPDLVVSQANLISRRLNRTFHDCGVGEKYLQALKWSLVFNTMHMKFLWSRGGLRPYIVEPHNFGVMREDVPDLQDQEAFTHSYVVSLDELKRKVSVLPNGQDIIRRVTATPTSHEDAFPESVNRLIVAGTANFTSATTRGLVNVPELFTQLQYKPKTSTEVVEMHELWVWDDANDDYRTITVAAPGVVIYGRKEIGNLTGVKGVQPFVKVCPNELYDYYFGWPEVVSLVKLQDWMSQRLREIRHILSKQANPSKSIAGFGGITDEKIAAFDNPGGWLSEANPNAKIEYINPDMPNDIWHEIIMLQSMYNDVSGLSDVLQGKGESGVRAKAHADILAKLGSARIKQRAQSVEHSLEEVGELVLRLMKKKDNHKYDLDGRAFTAAQFTDEFSVRVDAHSASPVFSDDHTQLAFMLRKFGAIDNVSLLELTKPPRQEIIKKRMKDQEKARAEQMKQMIAAGVVPGKGGALKSVAGK